LIAYRRHELEVSRDRFALSHRRDERDCEPTYYLGLVLAELRTWDTAASTLTTAVACIDTAETALRAEIDQIRASTTEPPARQARQIARRERQIASGIRMRATSWFNLAVAYYSQSKAADARA